MNIHNTCHACIAISVTVLDGGHFNVNSRILEVEESSLLKDILCMVTSDNDARHLMCVQTALDPGTNYDAVPDDNGGLHVEFGGLPWRLLRH